MLLEDVGGLKKGWAIDVSLYDDHLELKNFAVKQPITLKYSQITDVFHGYTTEIQEKEKSVIGRAVAGGLLFGGVGAVVGATYPEMLKELREKLPHTFFLVPGYGAQGGGAEDAKYAFDTNGIGAIVNSSRGIMCAWQKQDGMTEDDFAKAARVEAIRMREDLQNVIGEMKLA
jgi:orotidine-5'-phosphate decarboxylase